MVTGRDVITVQDSVIQSVYVFIDASSPVLRVTGRVPGLRRGRCLCLRPGTRRRRFHLTGGFGNQLK